MLGAGRHHRDHRVILTMVMVATLAVVGGRAGDSQAVGQPVAARRVVGRRRRRLAAEVGRHRLVAEVTEVVAPGELLVGHLAAVKWA